MTEGQLSAEIKKLAKLYRWRACHFRPGRTDKGWRTPIEGDPGFPDWVMCREEADGSVRMVIAELKSEVGIVSPKQRVWLNMLKRISGLEVYVWRPSDIDEIEECLR